MKKRAQNKKHEFDFSKVVFETTRCLLCKDLSKTKTLYTIPDRLSNIPGQFTLVKCQNCGLVFQDPRPKEKYIHYYYPKIWYTQQEATITPFQKYLTKKVLINYYNYTNLGKKNILTKIILFPFYSYFFKQQSLPKYKKNGKLLEIGCSVGVFLKNLKELGWSVCGIEVNKKAALIARKKRGLSVKQGSISNLNFRSNTFDAIIFDMVIAHLYHPNVVLKKIIKWLKKDGQLIFSLPYIDGFEYRYFKEYSYGLHLPVHLYYFNKKNIYSLLNKSFRSIKFIFHHNHRDMTMSAQFRYQDAKNNIDKIMGYNKFIRKLINGFVYILSLLGKTSRMTVFAIKK